MACKKFAIVSDCFEGSILIVYFLNQSEKIFDEFWDFSQVIDFGVKYEVDNYRIFHHIFVDAMHSRQMLSQNVNCIRNNSGTNMCPLQRCKNDFFRKSLRN